jgi:hypothetical protein
MNMESKTNSFPAEERIYLPPPPQEAIVGSSNVQSACEAPERPTVSIESEIKRLSADFQSELGRVRTELRSELQAQANTIEAGLRLELQAQVSTIKTEIEKETRRSVE